MIVHFAFAATAGILFERTVPFFHLGQNLLYIFTVMYCQAFAAILLPRFVFEDKDILSQK
jgi:hypothetical protein